MRGSLLLPHYLLDAHPEETGLNLTKMTRVHQLYQAEILDHITGPGVDPDLDLDQDLIPEEVLDQEQHLNCLILEADQDLALTPGTTGQFQIHHEILKQN